MPPDYVGKTLYEKAVFVDTGAFVGLCDASDQHHSEAVECFDELRLARYPLFTAWPIVHETHRRLLFNLGRDRALKWLAELPSSGLTIVSPQSDDYAEAFRLLEHYHYLYLTLTDAVAMAIMTRVGIAMAFSFDGHFLDTGLIRIPPFKAPIKKTGDASTGLCRDCAVTTTHSGENRGIRHRVRSSGSPAVVRFSASWSRAGGRPDPYKKCHGRLA